MKPWVIISFLTFDTMDRTLKQYFAVKLLVFQFYPFWNFGKFINFGLGIVRSERGKHTLDPLFVQGPVVHNPIPVFESHKR